MLAHARRIAKEYGVVDGEGRPVVGAEHLFLAVLADGDGVPAQALCGHHDPERLMAAVLAVMDTPEYGGNVGRDTTEPRN